MGESRIAGLLRAHGVLGADAQRIVRLHCERGNAQEMIEAVADAMLAEAMSSGRIPHNAGLKTKELLDRAESAIIQEVTSYHDKGGVLVAKGYSSVIGLSAEMAKQWIRGFAPPIPEEVVLRGTLSDPEVQDRLTVVALRLRQILLESTMVTPEQTEAGFFMKEESVEGFCQRAAIEMFKAFEKPNAANHSLIHKEPV